MGHHDLFFKKIFLDRVNAADFLRHALAPELTSEMDLNSLVIEKGSHVDTALAENFSDMVYTCRFSGTRIRVALLFEHKSAPDNNLPFQLHRYMGNLWLFQQSNKSWRFQDSFTADRIADYEKYF